MCSEFDRSCTIKVFGYSSVAEYYQDINNTHRLHLVKRPMICIQAEDDPFAPQKSVLLCYCTLLHYVEKLFLKDQQGYLMQYSFELQTLHHAKEVPVLYVFKNS